MGKRVVLAMSGGVDSSVAAVLLEGARLRRHRPLHADRRRGGRASAGPRRAAASPTPSTLGTSPIGSTSRSTRSTSSATSRGSRITSPTSTSRAARQPVRDVQHLAQVRQALVLRQAGRRRLRGDRPLRPDRRGRATGRRGWRGDSIGEGSVVRPLRAAGASCCRTSCSRWAAIPRPRSARSPASTACRSTTSPTARRSASCPTTITSPSSATGGPAARPPGAIVDEEGTVLGEHAGIEAFTIGQRRGLGIAVG